LQVAYGRDHPRLFSWITTGQEYGMVPLSRTSSMASNLRTGDGVCEHQFNEHGKHKLWAI
jgi:hypothetical protein